MLTEKVTFSLPCLKSLVASDTSCVFCETNYKRSLTLLPMHLHDLKQSVREVLASKVTTYDIELGGIILSHKNVKICSSVELNDEGHFTLEYIADIYIFKPQIGSILNGRINKKGRDVLGCLVHSVFNVALPRSRCEEDSSKKWFGSKALIGKTVTFSVVKLDFTGRLPYIRGQLLNLEDKSDIDDEGADSGMGYQESNEDDSSVFGINDPQTSHGENKSSLSSLKRKRNLSNSLTDSPKAKKKRFHANSSDEGLSGEELGKDTLSSEVSNRLHKKEVENTMNNSVASVSHEDNVEVKEEPTDETTTAETKTSKPKKKKKDRVNPSSSTFTDFENLSSSLLSEVLEKTKIKNENTSSLDEIDSLSNALTEDVPTNLPPEKLKTKKKQLYAKGNLSENIENLSLSLLKEAMDINSLAESVEEGITHDHKDDLAHRKKKKKKQHSYEEGDDDNRKLKLNTTKQTTDSQDFRNSMEDREVVKKKKGNKNVDEPVNMLTQSKLPVVPIKEEVEDVVVEGKKRKRKHKENDMNAISSALIEQAIKDLSVKIENIKQENYEEVSSDNVSNKIPSKKKKFST